jgi:MFS family permease
MTDHTDISHPLHHPRRWLALTVAVSAVFMDLVDNTIVVIALPSIQRTLHASASALQWTVAGYTLAFALLLTRAAGWAIDTAAGPSSSPASPGSRWRRC